MNCKPKQRSHSLTGKVSQSFNDCNREVKQPWGKRPYHRDGGQQWDSSYPVLLLWKQERAHAERSKLILDCLLQLMLALHLLLALLSWVLLFSNLCWACQSIHWRRALETFWEIQVNKDNCAYLIRVFANSFSTLPYLDETQLSLADSPWMYSYSSMSFPFANTKTENGFYQFVLHRCESW